MAEAPEHPLSTDDLVRIGARADAWFDLAASRHHGKVARLQFEAASWGVMAAAGLAARMGAVGLVEEIREWAEYPPNPEDPLLLGSTLAHAVAVRVARGVAADVLRPLLHDVDSDLAKAVARALDPEREGDLVLLHELADDARAEVAAIARERLGPRWQWRWHLGLFAEDPIAHAESPQIAHALSLARTALGLDEASQRPQSWKELEPALAELPDHLALPMLSAAWPRPSFHGGSVVAAIHARAGVAAVVDAMRRWAGSVAGPEHMARSAARACLELPVDARVELAGALLPWCVEDGFAADLPVRHDPRQRARQAIAEIVSWVWPPEVAPMPLVEIALAHRDDYGGPLLAIHRTIADTTADLGPHADPLVPLSLEDPGLLTRWPAFWQQLADGLPLDRLGDWVDQAGASDHDGLRTWAMQQRTLRLTPPTAGERTTLAQTWLEDEATRKLAIDSQRCLACVLPQARAMLVAGRLEPREAMNVLCSIGRLYGGAEPVHDYPRAAEVEIEQAARRAQIRDELGPWLDPHAGPPTSEEWAALRRAWHERLRVPDAERWWGIFWVLPVGPWRAEDVALLDALESAGESLPDARELEVDLLRRLCTSKPPPEAVARVRRALDRLTDEDHRWARGLVDELQAFLRREGVDPSRLPVHADWMDRDP